jgi:uncharacterized delta-60 repeat protein
MRRLRLGFVSRPEVSSLLLGLAVVLLALSNASAAWADDGAPDTTFGNDGAAFATVPGTPAPDRVTINSLVRAADGRLYAVGSARFGGTDTRFYVERFLSDGTPDAGFGDDGAALVDFPGSLLDEARSAVLQPDGKLIVAGYVRNEQGLLDPAIARLLTQGQAAGAIDTTFAQAGRLVDTSFEQSGSASPASAVAAAVVIESNNTVTRIRIYGPLTYPTFHLWPDMIQATYDLDGTKISGNVTGDFANVEAAVARSDGRYAVAGFGSPTIGGPVNAPSAFAIGLNEPTTRIQFPGSTGSFAEALTLTPDGGAVAAGSALIGGASRIALAKVRLPFPEGQSPVDTSFGSNGRVLTNVFGNARARAILAQPDGKLIVAGTAKNGGNDFFVLVRYNADGSLDPSFGGDGIVTTLLPGVGGQVPGGIVRTGDGRLIVGGSARLTTGEKDAVLTRYGRGSCSAPLGCVSLLQLSANAVLVSADLQLSRQVGILVRRVGRHGRATLIGRVPFGLQHAGNIHIRWNRRVSGKRLRPGTYLVNVRALRRGRVVAVSKPIRIRIGS